MSEIDEKRRKQSDDERKARLRAFNEALVKPKITVDGKDLSDQVRNITVNSERRTMPPNTRPQSYTCSKHGTYQPGSSGWCPICISQRPPHCPPWLINDEVIIQGTGQQWKVTSADWQVVAGEAQRMTLELISVGHRDVSAQRKAALEQAPDDVRESLKSLYELEDALPADKEAVVEMLDPREHGTRFRVRVVDRDSQ
jgi:hypothetical protein